MERVSKALEEAHKELTAIIDRQREQQAVDEEIGRARTTLEECIAELRNDAQRSEKTAQSLLKAIKTLDDAVRILKEAELGKVREDIGNAWASLAEQVEKIPETLENTKAALGEQIERAREENRSAHTMLAEQIRRSRTVAWMCAAISLTSLAAVGAILYRMMNP